METHQFSVSQFGKIALFDRNETLMGAPLLDENSIPVGVMVAPFPLDWLRETLTEYENHSSYDGLVESGEVSLIQWRRGEEGTAIHFINQLKRDELREPSPECQRMRTEEAERFSMLDVLRKNSGDGWSLNPSCAEVYTVWRWIPDLGWGMTMNQHKEELLGPLADLRMVTALLALLCLPLFIMLVRHQLRVVTQPISHLATAAKHGDILNYAQTPVEEVNTLVTALQNNVRRLVSANQAKDDFLASMSHELRTPLTAILGYSDVLMDDIRGEQQQQQLLAIRAAGEGQLALVNDILDVSKIESGKFSIEQQPFALEALIQKLNTMLSVKAESANLKLQFIQQQREPFQLLGDAQRIKQILINLIGNAIKFTEKGEVTVTIQHHGPWLQFSVQDSGIGIKPENMERLFKRFEQEDGTISRRFGGSGLGLFISRNLAELMGGQLTVSSLILF